MEEGSNNALVLFTDIELFQNMEQMGIYEMGTVHTNHMGLPAIIMGTKAIKKMLKKH